jgi:hypothetical protein
MFEHRSLPLLSRRRFILRIAFMTIVGAIGLAISLGIGIAGYHYYEGLSVIDSFANAAMILSGMGPLNQLTTTSGKLFAGIYALFSGLTFITVTGVVLSPIVHRIFHRFHLEMEKQEGD